jgi:calcium-dependent protein kinase
MLADPSDDAEVRLIDFGAAIWCKGETVECSDLIGTPWFVSPEGLGHTFTFKSDVWSVGVLTYQLLSGKMPFNDIQNPTNPSLNVIFRMIFTHDPTYDKGVWTDISEDAKDFISKCLNKDYTQRPSAIEALDHPWLTKTDCNDRFTGTPLVCSPFICDDGTIMHARTMINI